MERRSSFLEQPDALFIASANTIKDQCTQHVTEWKIEQERLTSLTLLTTNANTAYEANSDLATRNHITVTNKKSAFSNLKQFLSLFIDYLEGNESVPDEALAIMGLRSRQHHAHQPDPRPDEAPAAKVSRQHDEMSVYVFRSEKGQPTKSTTRKNYRGFKIRWRFEDETTYHTEISTRLHYTIHFNREDEGRRVIIAVAWVNPRLEEGPWSEDIVEIVG
jgi:hypothetical protein